MGSTSVRGRRASFNLRSPSLISMSSYLGERSFRIVQLHFSEGLTQAEIGERVGLSQQRVDQIIDAAIEKLRSRPGVILDIETSISKLH